MIGVVCVRGCCRDRQRTPATRPDPAERFGRTDSVDAISALEEAYLMDEGCFGEIGGGWGARMVAHAEVAELVDAADSKSASGNRVGVRFPPPALRSF